MLAEVCVKRQTDEAHLGCCSSQVGNWVQAMLLNPSRSRRRLRRSMDDWANLYQHALNADMR